MICVRDLVKTYPDLKRGDWLALDGVTLQARPGEIYGLLGANGAGKTTLMRILATMLQPTSGTAVVCGYDVSTQGGHVRRQIGFVSANTASYDRMTAWEMVQFFGRLHQLDSRLLEHRMQSIFQQFQMDEIRDVLVAKLSTGQKQKVSIARSIVHDPPVLIFDEATTGLDVLAARSLLQQIAQLRDQGKCIIYSSHIMREAERLCDRVGILHRGRLLAEGTLAQIRHRFGQDDLEELFHQLVGSASAGRPIDEAIISNLAIGDPSIGERLGASTTDQDDSSPSIPLRRSA